MQWKKEEKLEMSEKGTSAIGSEKTQITGTHEKAGYNKPPVNQVIKPKPPPPPPPPKK